MKEYEVEGGNHPLFGGWKESFDQRENEMLYTSKHRLLGTKVSLSGESPLKPHGRKE